SLSLGSDNLTGSASNDLFYLDAQVALGGTDIIQGSGGTDRLLLANGEGIFARFDASGAGQLVFNVFNAVPTIDGVTPINSTSSLNLIGIEELQVSDASVNMANPGNENVLNLTSMSSGTGYAIVGTSSADSYTVAVPSLSPVLIAALGDGPDVLSINQNITSGSIDMGSMVDIIKVGTTDAVSTKYAKIEFSGSGGMSIGYGDGTLDYANTVFDRNDLNIKVANADIVQSNEYSYNGGLAETSIVVAFDPIDFLNPNNDYVNYDGASDPTQSQLQIYSGGKLTYKATKASVEKFYGTSGNDTITLGAGDLVAIGGAGDDVINVTASNQIVVGGLGADRITYNVGGTTLKYNGSTFQDLANEIMGDNINGGYLNSQYDYGTGANQGVLDSSTIIELGKLPISYMGSQISAAPTQVNIDSGQNFGSVGNYEIGLFDLSASFGMTNQNGGGNVVIAIDNGDGYLSSQDIFIDVDDDFVSFEISEGIGALGDTTTMITNFA
ncbi:hypothetical protein N9A13_01025, partial [Alphaproteobacteria bacterium]|nr:hypothetical protein [Alphaproteobacteria bacterium]